MFTPLLLAPIILATGTVVATAMLAQSVGVLAPFVFAVTYVLGLGAVLLMNIGVFGLVDAKFSVSWAGVWLEIFWPLWATSFAPNAISALFACWFSRPPTRTDAIRLLSLYLLLILFAVQSGWLIDAGPAYLISVFVVPSATFFAIAGWNRANGARRESSTLRGASRP